MVTAYVCLVFEPFDIQRGNRSIFWSSIFYCIVLCFQIIFVVGTSYFLFTDDVYTSKLVACIISFCLLCCTFCDIDCYLKGNITIKEIFLSHFFSGIAFFVTFILFTLFKFIYLPLYHLLAWFTCQIGGSFIYCYETYFDHQNI